MIDYDDEYLLRLLIEIDDEAIRNDEPPAKRHLFNPPRVMERLGHNAAFLGANQSPLARRLYELGNELFRKQDLKVGGLQLGTFLFRGSLIPFYIPIGYGKIKLVPLELIELTPLQIRLMSSDEGAMKAYEDCCFDLFDVAYGFDDFSKMEVGRAVELVRIANFNLQAASSAVATAFDVRGSINSALLACELSLKGLLVAKTGVDEKFLRKNLSHDRIKIVNEIIVACVSNFDHELVSRVSSELPEWQKFRYEDKSYTLREIGKILMNVQFIMSETARALSQRNIRAAASISRPRVFPSPASPG